MAVSIDDTSFSLSSRVSRPVDGAVINLRWVLIFLAGIAVYLITGQAIPHDYFLLWLISYAAFNSLMMVGMQYRQLPRRLPVLGLIGDILFLSFLPLLPGVNSPFLILFAIFPTLVAAMRYGVSVGALVAIIILLPYEGLALLQFLPAQVRALIPFSIGTSINPFAAFIPAIALLGAVILVGYLTAREREAAIGTAHLELVELRTAIASARMFYESSDSLSGSTNYVDILDVMLQAGVNGMPKGRNGSVGMALLYDDKTLVDNEKALKVIASRGLDHTDGPRMIPGKRGIVARAMDSGDPIPFTKTAGDPELAQFTSLRRAHTGVCYPLQAGLDVYGAVILSSASNLMPSDQHLRLMRAFINQAAVAFQNAQLYQNLRAERDRIIEAEASARSKLARDLHDGPTQSIAALAMRLDFIRLLLDRDPPQAKQELEQARESVMRVGKDLRGLLFTLRPLTLESQGLSAALKQFGERLRENDNVPIQVQPGNFGNELEPNIAGTVFAVIEEAVNNARKHAKGAPINVQVSQQGSTLIAVVRDEGPGFDTNAVSSNYSERGSLGMVNMQDRARLVEGTLNVESAPGRGTRITLRVPITDRRAKARPQPTPERTLTN